MKAVLGYWRKEPAAIVSVIVALLAAFAVPAAWAKVIVAVISLIGGGVTRSQVYAPATIEDNPVANAAVQAANTAGDVADTVQDTVSDTLDTLGINDANEEGHA